MKHLRRFGFAICAVGCGTGILIACGDDNAVILDVATDSGRETSTLAPTKDVANDTFVAPETDSGADAGDAGEPGPVDAQADVELPPVDSGAPDADASDLAKEFPRRVAAEICVTTARCCFGDPDMSNDAGVDGGHFDQQKCLNNYFPNGFDQSNPGATVDFTKVTYNPSKASECLSRIHVLACGANAAEYRALVAACYAALQGTGGAGAACALTSECQSGFFCNTSVGGGTCEAIRTAGDACGDWTTNAGLAQNTCSNRFSGAPPRFCHNIGDAATPALLPADQWKCDDAHALGEQCFNNSWCNGGVCPSSGPSKFTCQDFITTFTEPGCKLFVAP